MFLWLAMVWNVSVTRLLVVMVTSVSRTGPAEHGSRRWVTLESSTDTSVLTRINCFLRRDHLLARTVRLFNTVIFSSVVIIRMVVTRIFLSHLLMMTWPPVMKVLVLLPVWMTRRQYTSWLPYWRVQWWSSQPDVVSTSSDFHVPGHVPPETELVGAQCVLCPAGHSTRRSTLNVVTQSLPQPFRFG